MNVEDSRFKPTIQARASQLVKKISLAFGGRTLPNGVSDRIGVSNKGLKSRFRASSMDIPRKPFVSSSQPALSPSSPTRPDMDSEESSNASVRTSRNHDRTGTNRESVGMPAWDVPPPELSLPLAQSGLPGIVVTQHHSSRPPSRSTETPPNSRSRGELSQPDLALEMPTPVQARAPLLRPWTPPSLPAPGQIPSGLISPMALGSPAVRSSPSVPPTSTSTSTPVSLTLTIPTADFSTPRGRRSPAPRLKSLPQATVGSNSTPQAPLNTRVDKQGQPLRVSPAIIQRVPPWPIMSLPALPNFPSLSALSSSSSPTSPSPIQARRASLGLSLSPTSASTSAPRRPSPSRLSTMPTLPMSGSERPQVCEDIRIGLRALFPENESPENEHDMAHDMDDDEIDEMGGERDSGDYFGRGSIDSARSVDSARTERGRDAEMRARPSMDSIGEDGRWTPSPSPSPSSSTFPSRARTPLPFSSASQSYLPSISTKIPMSGSGLPEQSLNRLGELVSSPFSVEFGWGMGAAFASVSNPLEASASTTLASASTSAATSTPTTAAPVAGYFNFEPHLRPNGAANADVRTPTLANSGAIPRTPRPGDFGLELRDDVGLGTWMEQGLETSLPLASTIGLSTASVEGLPTASATDFRPVSPTERHPAPPYPASHGAQHPASHGAQPLVSHGALAIGSHAMPHHRSRPVAGMGEDRKVYHHPSRSMVNLSMTPPVPPPSPPSLLDKGKGKESEVNAQPVQQKGTASKSKSVKRRQSMPSMAAQPPAYSSTLAGGAARVTPRDEEGREPLPRYSNDILLIAQMPRKVEFTQPGVMSRDRKWRRVWCVLEGTKFGVYKVRGVKSVWEGVVGAGDVTVHKPASAVRKEKEVNAQELGRVRKVEEESRVVGEEERRAAASRQSQSRDRAPSPASSSFLLPHSNSPPLSRYPSSSNISSRSSAPSGEGSHFSVHPLPLRTSAQRRRSGSSGSAASKTEPDRPDPSLLVREYTLQNAESGLGTDYTKRRNVIRVRMEGEQFLLQAKDVEDVVEWIEGLQAASNIALDLEERVMPRGPLFPRRRRRRRARPAGDTISTATSTTPAPAPGHAS